MKRKMLAILATGLLLGADYPRDKQAAKEVEKAITALNEAFHARDVDQIKALITDDYLAVTTYYGGPLNKVGQLKSLPDHKFTEYSPGKIQVTMLSKDTALARFILVQKGTYKGRPMPARSFASAVWVRRAGKWQEAFYQETPLPDKE